MATASRSAQGRCEVRRLKLLAMALAPLLMTYCHATVTGPRLWAHNSSAAFDTFVAFYLFDIIFAGWAILYAAGEWRRK